MKFNLIAHQVGASLFAKCKIPNGWYPLIGFPSSFREEKLAFVKRKADVSFAVAKYRMVGMLNVFYIYLVFHLFNFFNLTMWFLNSRCAGKSLVLVPELHMIISTVNDSSL